MSARAASRLDETLERAADGACAIRGDGRILLWNRAAERILGYSARDAVDRLCCDLFVGFDDSGNRLCYRGCHVTKLVEMGDPVHSFDMRTRTKSGHPVWINLSILVIPGDEAIESLTVHLFRDVTATKELLNLVHERLAGPMEAAPAATLTRRETEILRLVARGANTRTVAEQLRVSPSTVRNHVQNILDKLGAHSRLEAVAYATRHRLL
jgi:PAS domain S-box-containing protein